MTSLAMGRPDFEVIFEKAPGLYLVLTPEFEIAAASDAYCRAAMAQRHDLLGRCLFEALADSGDPKSTGFNHLRLSLSRVLNLRRADATAVQRYDIRRPDSEGGGFEQRYWSSLNTPVLDAERRVKWIIHRVKDVTELVRADPKGDPQDKREFEYQRLISRLRDVNDELARIDAERQRVAEELVRTRTFLDLVVENIPAMLFVKDEKELRFVLLNRAGEELLGYDRSQLIGKNDFDFFPTEQASFFTAQDREVLTSGKLRVIPEEPVATRTKGIRILQTKKMPVFDAEGRPAFLLGLSEDITDRKNAERQLARALKMEAIGQLTGGVAHDFNNLLTVILSNAETLADELGHRPDLRALAEMTQTAAERGAELTKSLLAFARRQTLEPQVVNVNKLVTGMEGLLRRTLGEHVEIELVQGADAWPALVDPVQLESAILNLSINARDAMPDGGHLTIEISNAHIDDEHGDTHDDITAGRYVLISVTDSGTGMPADIMARIFEPFFSTKDVGKGTGLGLSMVYGFVKQSGGHIKVTSEVGHGTVFKIYLPRSPDLEAAADPEADAKRAVDPTGSETVLLVEDNQLVREHAERVLRALGYTVLCAANGREALTTLERGDSIDLLFTDVVMPGGMSGGQLADRALALRPALKVLFTSGYTENAIDDQGRLQPGVHLLRKPYRQRELATKLRQALGAAQARSVVRPASSRSETP